MVYEILNRSAFLIAALVILLMVLVYTLQVRRNDRARNKVFILMIVLSVICTVCEMIKLIVYMLVTDKTSAMVLLDGVEFLHTGFHVLIPMLFCYYIILINGSHRHLHGIKRILFFLPVIIIEVLLLTNPLHQLMYVHDEVLKYHSGFGSVTGYVFATVYFIVSAANLMKHKDAINRRRLVSVLILFPIIIAGIFCHKFFEGVNCEMFASALTMLGIMLTIENEDDRMDAVCKIYNRAELRMKLGNFIRLGQSINVITIRLTNYDILMRLSGKSGVDPVMKRVAECLKEEYSWYRLYRASTTSFMILTDLDKEEAVQLSERIYVRFMEGIYIDGIDTPVTMQMMRTSVPEELSTVEELMLMVDGPLPADMGRGIISGEKLKYLTRSNNLEEAMQRGLENGGFSIEYQSAHNIKDLKLCAIKALVRLTDEKLGVLMPGEFIPQAERTGQIREIGDFVLGEVCRFIKSGVPARLGCRCIYINLSFLQCLAPDYASHIISVVESYGVDPGMIMFEITKPVDKSDFEVLERFMKVLKTRGFGFLMEDFGTGYSNVEAILALDFDVVKIDRSILWEAVKSENGKVVLENAIHMIKELKRKILAEGIEDSSQIDMLKDLEVDYLSGYFFSRPVPADRMEELI